MDRSLASYDRPLLNQGVPYEPDAGRTAEDDAPLVYPVAATLHKKTHISEGEFQRIYKDTMRYFTEQEKYAFRQYQSGERKPEQFYRECHQYLTRNFEAMKNKNDFDAMMERIDNAMFHYDVVQPLIDHPDTTDIKICGPYDIRVRVKGKAYKSDATFMDEADLFRFVSGLAIRNRVDIFSHPVLTFTDNHDKGYILRFTVSSPMVNCVDYPYLHIRKVSKSKSSFNDLINAGMLNEDVKMYLIDRAKASRGIVFAGPPGCVDCETEFFNGKEWKSIAEYAEGEKVLQFDPVTNEATLVTPLKYIKEPCNKMYHFETCRGTNQTLSPEHRVLYYTRNFQKKTYSDAKEMSAEEMYQLQCQGKFNGYIKTDFKYSGKGISLSDGEIKLMLAVICDGSFPSHHSDRTNYCSVRLKKIHKKQALESILKECGLSYHQLEEKDGYTRYSFQAPRKEKVFTSDWYQCSDRQLQIVCDNILQWDGSYGKHGSRTFSTTVKENADFVQFAYATCGQRVSIAVQDRCGQVRKSKNGDKEYIRKSVEYSLCISNHNMVSMQWDKRSDNKPIPAEVVPTDGFKYCFTVPTHALVLRRKGRIFLTKNSGKTTALNAFIEYIPKTRETLVIQENDELYTEQSGFMFKHVSHGFQGEPICTLEDLGKMALVEGCNEFIIGEVKGGEMRYAMTLLNAGGYAALTVHSTNAYETMDKLADLVKYGSSYSFDEARRMLKTFDTVVYMEGFKIREILEVDGYDDDTHNYNYINIYRYIPPEESPPSEEAQ